MPDAREQQPKPEDLTPNEQEADPAATHGDDVSPRPEDQEDA
jgi:hypothetical protein